MADTEFHICVEQTLKKGVYYLLADVNYRYVNTNGKNHLYNVTAYSEKPVLLENVTDKMDVSDALEKAMISYCKKTTRATRDSSGVNVYIAKNYNQDIPFMAIAFENPSSNYYKATVNCTSRGTKSYCIYCDSDANENAASVTKEIPANGATAVSILKYTTSSMISASYSISASSGGSGKNNKGNISPSPSTGTSGGNSKNNSAIDNNPVFREEGEAIDDQGYLIQYYLGVSGGFTIGLENRGNATERMKIILEGLEFSDTLYKGRSSPTFTISPGEKKVFNTTYKPRFYGDMTFQFDYA